MLTLLLNPTAEDQYFILPAPQAPGRVLIDTARPDAEEMPVEDGKVGVRAHSAVLIHSTVERRCMKRIRWQCVVRGPCDRT